MALASDGEDYAPSERVQPKYGLDKPHTPTAQIPHRT
jgi:hypothetical protein